VLYQLSYMGRCRFRPTYKVTKTDRIAPSEIEIKKHRSLILSPCRLEALSLLLKVRQASRKLNKESHPVNRILRARRPLISPRVPGEKNHQQAIFHLEAGPSEGPADAAYPFGIAPTPDSRVRGPAAASSRSARWLSAGATGSGV
jgi:hypothetical protein